MPTVGAADLLGARGDAGTFIVRGIGWSVIPVVATIWVNRRTPSNVRATVQSFLGQAESVGEITGGVLLGVVAQWSMLPIALTGSAGLFLLTFVIVTRSRAGRSEPAEINASPPSRTAAGLRYIQGRWSVSAA